MLDGHACSSVSEVPRRSMPREHVLPSLVHPQVSQGGIHGG